MTIGVRRTLYGVQRAWDERIVPALVDYARIPAQSLPDDAGRRRVDLLALFALALLLRLLGVAIFHTMPVSDARTYDELARLVASGERVFDTYRTPGYVMFLALCYRLLGPDPLPAQIVQAVVGSIGVLVVYLLALRLTNRPIAFTAGILAATHFGLVVFTTELLSETLFVTFLALLCSSSPLVVTGRCSGVSSVASPSASPHSYVLPSCTSSFRCSASRSSAPNAVTLGSGPPYSRSASRSLSFLNRSISTSSSGTWSFST